MLMIIQGHEREMAKHINKLQVGILDHRLDELVQLSN